MSNLSVDFLVKAINNKPFIMKNLILAAIVFASSTSFGAALHRLSLEKIYLSKAKHKIELGVFTDYVPIQLVQVMMSLKGVTPIKKDGVTIYMTAPYADEQLAAKQLPKLRSLGFSSAQHVVEYKRNYYPVREFNHYVEKGKIKDDSTPPVVRIWK